MERDCGPTAAARVPRRLGAGCLAAIRDARWLGADHAMAWARALAVMSALAVAMAVLVTHGGTVPGPGGHPIGTDFVSFWTAGGLALHGHAGAAWFPPAHAALQRDAFAPAAGYQDVYYAFFYPPPFLLFCLPLALLPYGAALAVWLAATGAAYAAAIRAILPRRWPGFLPVLAFPGLLVNAAYGQNGALSAGIIGAAALCLDRRPRLAGACLGCLCFKPQLAILAVPALVMARRWRALAWAAASSGTLCVASLAVLGADAWRGFLADAPLARAALEAGLVGFEKMASTFAAVRLLGGGLSAAWIAQALVSLAALAAVASVARRRPGGAAEMAAMAAAACLATPFVLYYDLMLLAVPLAWLAAQAARGGFLPWEKALLAAGFLAPLLSLALATRAGMPVAPIVAGALLAAVIRRAGMPQRSG